MVRRILRAEIERRTTALNYAVLRGDLEIVKILLENGADPYIENDLGLNAFDFCDKYGPFPKVFSALSEFSSKDGVVVKKVVNLLYSCFVVVLIFIFCIFSEHADVLLFLYHYVTLCTYRSFSTSSL